MTGNADQTPTAEHPDLPAERRAIDAAHSQVEFRVRKMGMYFVKGRFRDVQGWLEVSGDGAPRRGELEIDARSISTRMPPRDWHLRTRDFLDVKRHPKIGVIVDAAEHLDGELRVLANVSLHGVTRAVQLSGHLHGNGSTLAIHLTGALDRRSFEIRARPPFEWIVGREVLIDAVVAVAAP